MKAATRRAFFVTVISLLIVAATFYGFLPKPAVVELEKVAKGPFRAVIEEEGRTRIKERYVVSAPVAGYMMRNGFKAGEHIRRGETLVLLEPLHSQPLDRRSREEGKAAVLAAEAALEAAREKERAAQADFDYIGKRLERIRNLYSKRYVARDQLDQTEAEAKKAQAVKFSVGAAVDVARFELERTKALLEGVSSAPESEKLETVKVLSPLAGVVLRVYRESEGAVNAGEPLMEIGDLRNIEVRAEVLSADAVKIKKGTEVLFGRWGGEEALEGIVRVVEPAGFTKISSLGVEEQRVLVIVDIASAHALWNALGDGYRLDASFIVREKDNVLQAPTGALFRSGSDWAVFVEEEGRAKLRIVRIGERNGLSAEVVAGLKEGDRVLIHPDDAVKDGGRIRAQR